jgi:hypothetical protein
MQIYSVKPCQTWLDFLRLLVILMGRKVFYMNKILKIFTVLSFLVCVADAARAQNLSSVASVNVTSDTAATAKNMALNEARRQIATEVLSQYSNPGQLADLMQDTQDSVLTNLISSTSIDGERLSATTYSANIKMTIDPVAAKKWLADNEIQNWLGLDDDANADKSTAIISLSGGLRDWIELAQALRVEKLGLDVKRIYGGQVTAAFPATARTKLISAIQNAGWQYSSADGFMQIWK